ncbi:tetratricopeptide repeat protein [Halomonas sp. V046]|uniref:tetratricopeptide repeat protein n=1 Tax=Halomonas sp. V046 TaxID=3459611 RepID=UPI00404440AB
MMILEYFSRKICCLFLLLMTSFSVWGGVLYDNPIDNDFSLDIHNSSYNELLHNVGAGASDFSVRKAQYLLGIIYINGWEKWGVDRDYGAAREYLQEAWDGSASDAGLILADIYYQGLGVVVDEDKALEYLVAAADDGLLIAQRELGRAYVGKKEWEGLVEPDIEKGIYWLERAGNAGDLKSARAMASLYSQGTLVEKDDALAFDWLLKSSESRYGVDSFSFPHLVTFFEEGIGTQTDLVQAYKYADLQGTAGIEDKQRLAALMTEEQVNEAIDASRTWQEEHRIFVPSYRGVRYQSDGSYR